MARYRESVSRVVVSIALIAAVVAVVILGTGGFGTTVLGRRVSAQSIRAAAVAAATFCSPWLSLAGDGLSTSRTIIWLRGPAFFDLCKHRCRCRTHLRSIWDRDGGRGLGCLAALAVTAALDKPFWHDEVFTVLISHISFATMYRAAADGIDFMPPLNTAYALVHGVGGVGPVATRLTPIASFLRRPPLSSSSSGAVPARWPR